MKTPDQIYGEFEARQRAVVALKKKKLWSRVGDVVLLIVPFVSLFVWGFIRKDAMIGSLGIPLFVYASVQLQKRWDLEARIERLENES
jgi:hypothetical protein